MDELSSASERDLKFVQSAELEADLGNSGLVGCFTYIS